MKGVLQMSTIQAKVSKKLLSKARRDSNPQPSDRQADALKSQVVVNKEVKRNAKVGLPPGLPPTLVPQPALAKLTERWRDLPEYTKQAILALAGVSE